MSGAPSTCRSADPGTMMKLWESNDTEAWEAALRSYSEVVARQPSRALGELDRWYHLELPGAIRGRRRPHVTHAELVRVTEWKMARGVWRAPNLALVRGNSAEEVERVSGEALAAVPQPTAPIAALAALAGVGPATASGVVSAFAPAHYPFFDELVAAQVRGLGKVAWTQAYYARYAAALRERAERLGGGWTPAAVDRALWAHVGGKAGVKAGR